MWLRIFFNSPVDFWPSSFGVILILQCQTVCWHIVDVNTSFQRFPTNFTYSLSRPLPLTRDYMYTYLILSVFHLSSFVTCPTVVMSCIRRITSKASGWFLLPPIHSDCSSPPLWSDHPCLHLDVWEETAEHFITHWGCSKGRSRDGAIEKSSTTNKWWYYDEDNYEMTLQLQLKSKWVCTAAQRTD
jgi:hypothetical protein